VKQIANPMKCISKTYPFNISFFWGDKVNPNDLTTGMNLCSGTIVIIHKLVSEFIGVNKRRHLFFN
jgi:hypothetical protein